VGHGDEEELKHVKDEDDRNKAVAMDVKAVGPLDRLLEKVSRLDPQEPVREEPIKNKNK